MHTQGGHRRHRPYRRARDSLNREIDVTARALDEESEASVHPERVDVERTLATAAEHCEEPALPECDDRVRTRTDALFKSLVNRDFEFLKEHYYLYMEPSIVPYLFMQSIAGRANEGHGSFRKAREGGGVRYPNATIEDVYSALEVSWKQAWAHRQSWIDDVKVWAERAARDPSDPRVRRLLSIDLRPLGGSDFIGSKELPDAQAVLAALGGLSFACSMDSYDWRTQVGEKYDHEMGGGECWAGRMDRMRSEHITLEMLASDEHSAEDLHALIRQGILLDRPEVLTIKDIRNVYVRRKKGKGVSDDAALIMPSLLHSPWCFYGAMLGDFVDTIDKSAARIVKGGQDEAIGEMVRDVRGDDLPFSRDKTVDLIYLSAIDPVRPVVWMHCSQRYFYQQADVSYAARLHELFMHRSRDAIAAGDDGLFDRLRTVAQEMPVSKLSFSQVTSTDFYLGIVNRLEEAQRRGIVNLRA